MASATLQTTATAVNFTRADLNAVANAAYQAVATDKAWTKAIDRAVTNLAGGQFSYDGHQVILPSATSMDTYRISVKEPMVCSCKGRARGYKCWHIVAARLVQRAAELHAATPQQPNQPRRYSRCQDCNRSFALAQVNPRCYNCLDAAGL